MTIESTPDEALTGIAKEVYVPSPAEQEGFNFIIPGINSKRQFSATRVNDLPDQLCADISEVEPIKRLLGNSRSFYEAGYSEIPTVEPASSDASDIYALYRRDASKSPLLTAPGEQFLAGLIATGQQTVYKPELFESEEDSWAAVELATAAYDKLYASNLRLVIMFANQYVDKNHLMDAIQDGNVGLMRACAAFDYRRGTRFNTYADDRIKQAIFRTKGSRNFGLNIGTGPVKDLRSLMARLGSNPKETAKWSDEKVAEDMRWSPDRLASVRQAEGLTSVGSHDAPMGHDAGSADLHDRLGDPKSDKGFGHVEAESMVSYAVDVAGRLPHPFGAAILHTLKKQKVIASIPKTTRGNDPVIRNDDTHRRNLPTARAMMSHPSTGYIQEVGETPGGDALSEARCIDQPVELFFLGTEAIASRRKRAQLCGPCAVRAECAATAVSLKVRSGYWGGQWFEDGVPVRSDRL